MNDFEQGYFGKLSNAEKANYFAVRGASDTVRDMIVKGSLIELSEDEQRNIYVHALKSSAVNTQRTLERLLKSTNESGSVNIDNINNLLNSRNRQILYAELIRSNPDNISLKEQIFNLEKDKNH